MGMEWSNRTTPGALTNQAARDYTDRAKSQTDTLVCQQDAGGEFPGYHWHYADEMILLQSTLNQQVKQGSPLAKTLKAHILLWQYYYIDDVKKTLVKQANRIEAKLKALEDTEIMQNVGHLYDKPYIPQGLAVRWKEWFRDEHARIELDVKKFLILWTKTAYDLNRPDDPKVKLQPGQTAQKNKNIMKMFEIYLSAVQNLQPWNIDWDMDISDDSSSDDEGMDID
ncbi:hypothetical protein BJX65DRAFT_308588 [Aspergillus insuetus]